MSEVAPQLLVLALFGLPLPLTQPLGQKETERLSAPCFHNLVYLYL